MGTIKNFLEWVKAIVIYLLIFAAGIGFIYGGYWVAKRLSYSFFYEDMVKRTIYDNVKTECLK